MGGPQLEVIKFGVYVFFPVGVMLYFGGPDFFDKHVKNIKFWPDYEKTHKPPTTSEEVRDALATLKAQREERWRKYREEQQQLLQHKSDE